MNVTAYIHIEKIISITNDRFIWRLMTHDIKYS